MWKMNNWQRIAIRFGLVAVIAFTFCANAESQWPRAAEKHRQTFAKAFRRCGESFDLRTLLAGQLEQESSFNASAVSPVGARGLGQFLEGTEGDMKRWYPELLKTGNAFDPQWAIMATCLYMKRLRGHLTGGYLPDSHGIAARSFNGGHGRILAERRLARNAGQDPNSYDILTGYCPQSRAEIHCPENLSYFPHILRRSKKYVGY